MTSPPRDGKRNRKLLTPEDEEVWRAVTRTLKPIKKARARMREAAHVVEPAPPVIDPPAPRRAVHAPPPAPASRTAPALTRMQPIEVKIKRRLARGRMDADMKIDLHGMRQAEAHAALRAFVFRARAEGARIVVVVTGKGRGSADPDTRAPIGGVLQRMARHWLAAPELRDCVIGFEEADAAHGGAGALYVRIRRARGEHP